jgi:hypothetical protein
MQVSGCTTTVILGPSTRCRWVGVQQHSFLAPVLDAGECSASRPGQFTPKERLPQPVEYKAVCLLRLIWMLWRTDYLLHLLGTEPWILSCPARSLVTTPAMLSYAVFRYLKKSSTNWLESYAPKNIMLHYASHECTRTWRSGVRIMRSNFRAPESVSTFQRRENFFPLSKNNHDS